jgi:hypothetical protein
VLSCLLLWLTSWLRTIESCSLLELCRCPGYVLVLNLVSFGGSIITGSERSVNLCDVEMETDGFKILFRNYIKCLFLQVVLE